MSTKVLGLCMAGNWEICNICFVEISNVNESAWSVYGGQFGNL